MQYTARMVLARRPPGVHGMCVRACMLVWHVCEGVHVGLACLVFVCVFPFFFTYSYAKYCRNGPRPISCRNGSRPTEVCDVTYV
jgi:hypothetical protein